MTECAFCGKDLDDGHYHSMNEFDEAEIEIKK